MAIQTFFALDVETANSDYSSICQIGMVRFDDGKPVKTWDMLINPCCFFDDVNIAVHGIDEMTVKDAPKLTEVFPAIRHLLTGQIAACHTHFDKRAMKDACALMQVPALDCQWVDTARVARRAWPQFNQRGYGLKNLCKHIGFEFKHHDAAQDALACGMVFVSALNESGKSLEEWVPWLDKDRRGIPGSPQPSTSYPAALANRDGNAGGHLNGEVVVFTGSLSLSREEAAEKAWEAGCSIGRGVTKKTTLLVIGVQDADKLAGHKQSSKERKARRLIESGQKIQIITETEFMQLIKRV